MNLLFYTLSNEHRPSIICNVLTGTGSPLPPITRGPFDACDLENTCFFDQSGQKVGDPENCTLYYECALGTHLDPRECAPGICFDTVSVGCTFCDVAVCEPPCPTTITYPEETTTSVTGIEQTITNNDAGVELIYLKGYDLYQYTNRFVVIISYHGNIV